MHRRHRRRRDVIYVSIHLRSPASLPMSDACAKNVSVFLSRRKRTRLGHIGATPFANASINPSRRRFTKHGTEKGGWQCTVAPHTHRSHRIGISSTSKTYTTFHCAHDPRNNVPCPWMWTVVRAPAAHTPRPQQHQKKLSR